jgi:uncharacterized protein YkwD
MHIGSLALSLTMVCSLTGCTANVGQLISVASAVAAATGVTLPGAATSPAPTAHPTTGSPKPATPSVAPSAGGLPAVIVGSLPGGIGATNAPAGELGKAFAAANRERQAAGVGPLLWSQPLADVAARHSADMVARGFFDHANPDGLSPFDRLTAAHIDYAAAAENIAQNNADDGEAVITQWMNSPGHRANLLSDNYGRMGLGVATSANGERYWTQDFTD